MHAVPLPAPSLAPLRSHPPEPVQTLQERLQVLDSPHEWEVFSTPWQQGAASPPDCWESRVVLEGMHCAACAFTIEDALQATPGVVEAEVNAATRRARVVWSATG
ncbi:MAG: heavy-metal-associated domain-containing protein, partial [Burkholderiaceae bacterium]|nr:heavy-metal-associated domain-containing protein [Burkholderiaceae bacterium]